MIGDQLQCRACITLPSELANNSDKNCISDSWRKLNSLSSNYNLIQAMTLSLFFVLSFSPGFGEHHGMVVHDLPIMTKTDSSRT